MLCPFCLNDVIFYKSKNEYICPQCKQEVPTIYVQDTDTKRVTVSAVGFSGHGKSVCFASLFYFLSDLSNFWPKFTSLPLDDKSIETVMNNSRALSRGDLPPPTPKNFPIPSIISFTGIPFFHNRFFLFYDIGGEVFEKITTLVDYASFIKNSRTMTFFISLSDLNEKIKKDGGFLCDEMKNLLNTYIGGYSKINTDGRKKSQDLLVVFTKGDRLKDMLPKDVWEYLCLNPSEIYDVNDKFSDDCMLKHIKQMKNISNSLQKFVDKELKARAFINLAKEYFKSVNFMVVSSLGAEPKGGKIKAIPKRVEDILIWLMYLQETNTFTKLQMWLKSTAINQLKKFFCICFTFI